MTQALVAVLLAVAILGGCAAPVRKPPPAPPQPPVVVQPAPPVERPAPAPEVPRPIRPLTKLAPEQYPIFSDDMDLASLEAAIDKSLQFYRKTAGGAPFPMDGDAITIADLRESLIALREILKSGDPEAVRQQRIRETFDVYQSTGSDGRNSVLFTGYFEPVLEGSPSRTPEFRYPVYRVPHDLVTVNLGKFRERFKGEQLTGRVQNGELIPYHSRGEIEDQRALEGRNLELAWVANRIDLFFLHTQGSGKIALRDGRLLQIGYERSNGRPYRSLGRHLLDTGRITPQEISYQAIKRYLRDNPGELSEILGHNESFIFFRVVEQGPVGSIGEILTAGRSIATDPAVFPRGSLAFIRTRKPQLDPDGNPLSWSPFSRFVVNQDAGGVIKGAGRVDLFCGTGGEAEKLAGSLKERGELFYLVRKRSR